MQAKEAFKDSDTKVISFDEYMKDFEPNPFHKGSLRNRICVCGSGKKLKQCHGRTSHIRKTVLDQLMNTLEENAAAEMDS